MTVIRIDPSELTAVAQSLRVAAAETADIGTDLSRCVRCAMPADVEALVNQIVSTADAILDEMARRTAASADDLLNRAAVAANDSLAAASSAPTAPATSFGGGVTMGGFGSYGTPMESPFGGGVTVGGFGAYGTPMPALFGGGAVVGGGGAYGTPMAASFGGGFVVGGTPALDSPSSPSAVSFASLPASWSGPNWRPPATNDPRLGGFIFALGQAQNANTSMHLLPSRADEARRLGRPVSVGEYDSWGIGGFTGRVDPSNPIPLLLAGLNPVGG